MTTWNGTQLSATEAAEALATQIVVDARRALQNGQTIDGPLLIAEVLSDCTGGYRGEYLRRCTEAAALRTVRTAVRRITKGA